MSPKLQAESNPLAEPNHWQPLTSVGKGALEAILPGVLALQNLCQTNLHGRGVHGCRCAAYTCSSPTGAAQPLLRGCWRAMQQGSRG